jgi:GDP-L-fucose synthase
MKKVLVTGAYGLVGKSFQKIVSQYDDQNGNKYIFFGRKDCDLRNIDDVLHCFNTHKPDIVVHLASCVGGVYENMNKNYQYLIDNIRINTNIVDACKKHQVSKLINILSTCIFPDKNVSYPLTSDQLHNGLPHESNIGYAYSKRVLHLASQLLTHNTDNVTKVINLTPTNLYGENDNYNLQASHVIPALIHKTYNAIQNNTSLQVYGSGNAIRQFLYVDDLSRVILHFINTDYDQSEISCIVSPPEDQEVSIKQVVKYISNSFDFKGDIVYNTSYADGQLKKTTNNNELLKYISDFEFTSLEKGIDQTVHFFKENYTFLRH